MPEEIVRFHHRPNWTPYGRMFDYDVTASLINSAGFSGAAAVIVFYSGLDVDGVQCREDIFLWTENGAMIPCSRVISFSESTSRQHNDIILPSTPGGETDVVSLRTVTDTLNTSSDIWEKKSEQISSYLWTGEEFRVAE